MLELDSIQYESSIYCCNSPSCCDIHNERDNKHKCSTCGKSCDLCKYIASVCSNSRVCNGCGRIIDNYATCKVCNIRLTRAREYKKRMEKWDIQRMKKITERSNETEKEAKIRKINLLNDKRYTIKQMSETLQMNGWTIISIMRRNNIEYWNSTKNYRKLPEEIKKKSFRRQHMKEIGKKRQSVKDKMIINKKGRPCYLPRMNIEHPEVEFSRDNTPRWDGTL